MDNGNLATELLHEIKATSRRWFIAFILMCVLEIATIAVFIWYISLPTDEISVESEDGNANYIGNDLNGELYNGKSNSEETSQR